MNILISKLWILTKHFGLLNYILLFFALLWDLALYFILALAAMNYEDQYSPEDGQWYSLESMSNFDVGIFSALTIWYLTNTLLVIYVIFRIFKRLRD